jgi:cell wall-associated NlpC family hydrolase
MSFVVCIVAVAPLRKEATHKSEMVSELLLGKFAEVVETSTNFILIKCLYDGYESWCQKSQLSFAEKISETSVYLTESEKAVTINQLLINVSVATPYFKKGLQLQHYHLQYCSSAIIDARDSYSVQSSIENIALKFLNVPYLWGGKSNMGIDCSGFTQQVFKLCNIWLPRDAFQQAELGEVVDFLQEANCGDLAFFDNEEGRITHVGIILNSFTIIHASANVRIDTLDNAGIINKDTGERTHRLRILKRYFN